LIGYWSWNFSIQNYVHINWLVACAKNWLLPLISEFVNILVPATWSYTWLRYLIEGAGGVFTGSRYKDLQIQMFGESWKIHSPFLRMITIILGNFYLIFGWFDEFTLSTYILREIAKFFENKFWHNKAIFEIKIALLTFFGENTNIKKYWTQVSGARNWHDGTTIVQKTHDASKNHVLKVRGRFYETVSAENLHIKPKFVKFKFVIHTLITLQYLKILDYILSIFSWKFL
jgi:hypothetical protein